MNTFGPSDGLSIFQVAKSSRVLNQVQPQSQLTVLPFVSQRTRKKRTSKRSSQNYLQISKRNKSGHNNEVQSINVAEIEYLYDTSTTETRRCSISQKMKLKDDPQFTKKEEQDIHERAELYCAIHPADENFFVLPDENSYHENRLNQSPPIHKKRRGYMPSSCYLTHNAKTDMYDNSHVLPSGSKLLRPPDKLVELVASAIQGSPDGLLQVPQIYYVLMNKYPYFRYMDETAVSSWRSSIRHALFQKWFRKIPFKTSTINHKGCYWAISQNYDPKEMSAMKKKTETKPLKKYDPKVKTKKPKLEDLELGNTSHKNILALLHEEEDNFEDFLEIAKEYGLELEEQDFFPHKKETHHVPSPVKDPDPILSTCNAENSQNMQDIYALETETAVANIPGINSPTSSTYCAWTEDGDDNGLHNSLDLSSSPGMDVTPTHAESSPVSDRHTHCDYWISGSKIEDSPVITVYPESPDKDHVYSVDTLSNRGLHDDDLARTENFVSSYDKTWDDSRDFWFDTFEDC